MLGIQTMRKARTARRPAAPIPAMPRPTSMVAMFWLPVLTALPTIKKNNASCRAQWRPKMSATEANGGRKTVEVRR